MAVGAVVAEGMVSAAGPVVGVLVTDGVIGAAGVQAASTKTSRNSNEIKRLENIEHL